ncbi:MAG: hypothetical protein HY040_14260 [Planctomycetes bacterium]|nr:hypothetical protein [Planctomycetota bacterium]
MQTYRVDSAWGELVRASEHGEAAGVACDSQDRVYVFVRGPRPVLVFDRDGKFLRSWGEGVFKRPHGIFIGPDDTVYCSDDCDHTVRIFSLDGEHLRTLGISGQPSETGATSMDYRTIKRAGPPFHYPTNVALAPSGDLFVSDGYGNARVHRFAPDGRLLQSWGEPGAGPGQFHLPHGIAVDAEETIFVADRENSRIQLFTSNGDFRGEWTDVARPCQVFINTDGRIYVAELGFRAGRWPGTGEAAPGAVGGRLSIFDGAGGLVARWGGGDNPSAPGDFFAPHGIWVDSYGDIYVAEVVISGGAIGTAIPCHTLQKFVRQPLGSLYCAS